MEEEKPVFAWYTDAEVDDSFECPFKKVIILDIDGVLNVEEEALETGVKVDPEKVKLLKMIVDETGADIILSSSWKRGYKNFVEDGLPHLLWPAESDRVSIYHKTSHSCLQSTLFCSKSQAAYRSGSWFRLSAAVFASFITSYII